MLFKWGEKKWGRKKKEKKKKKGKKKREKKESHSTEDRVNKHLVQTEVFVNLIQGNNRIIMYKSTKKYSNISVLHVSVQPRFQFSARNCRVHNV